MAKLQSFGNGIAKGHCLSSLPNHLSFDLSLKGVFLIVGDMLNLALGSLSSAKLLKFKQKIPTAKATVGMIKSDCTR